MKKIIPLPETPEEWATLISYTFCDTALRWMVTHHSATLEKAIATGASFEPEDSIELPPAVGAPMLSLIKEIQRQAVDRLKDKGWEKMGNHPTDGVTPFDLLVEVIFTDGTEPNDLFRVGNVVCKDGKFYGAGMFDEDADDLPEEVLEQGGNFVEVAVGWKYIPTLVKP